MSLERNMQLRDGVLPVLSASSLYVAPFRVKLQSRFKCGSKASWDNSPA